MGLIGVNGTGKSSLLKLIAGLDSPDEGNFISSKDYQISYLSQHPDLNPDLTILDQIFAGDAPIFRLLKKYEKTLLELNEQPENQDIQERLFELQKEMDALNGWDVSTNAKTILTKIGD